MSTTAVHPSELERAISNYLAVSRQAHLFEAGEYTTSEERAWARLAAAVAAVREIAEREDEDEEDEDEEDENEEDACTVSS